MIFSQPNNQLFTSKSKQASIILLLIACFALMCVDNHYKTLDKLRHSVALIVVPLQYTVDYPVRFFYQLKLLMGSKQNLIKENVQLRYQQTLLEAQLQKLIVLKEENSQLKELLLTASKAKTQAMVAQILAVETTHTRQVVILDKGQREGVYVGQPVLDAKGVMGQIIDVGYFTSTILLISDAKCAVSVRNNRTGERAILTGNNNLETLSLINLPKTSAINKGDLLVTSGLGRLYPEGYPIGRVKSVHHIPGEGFIKVRVSPVALLNRDHLVLLIWPDKEQSLITAQINERLNYLLGKSV